MKTKIFLSIFLLCSVLTASAAVADQWIHVKINDGGSDEVSINLPMSLLSAAVRMIPEEVSAEAEIALDDLNMGWEDFREFWAEVRDAPEATFVSIKSGEDRIDVKKEGQFVLITSDEARGGAEVDVKFPLAVVDALLSGRGDRLDFEAALQALADFGPGNLVSVRDGDSTVRVWIDNNNEAD